MIKTVKRVATVLVMTVVALLTGCGSSIMPPMSQTECVGKSADEVESAFKDAGFISVSIEKTETADVNRVGTVSMVTIENRSPFTSETFCKAEDPVTIVKYELSAFEPTIEVETGGEDGWPEFTIKTNLPDKTVLTLTLSDDNYYSEQQSVTVRKGEAKSKAFMEDKGLPLAGDYTLVIVMLPDIQKSKIQKQIGAAGETLTGELIETNTENGSRYVFYETGYHSPYTKGEIESALAPSKSLDEVAALIEQDLTISFADNTDYHYTILAEEGGVTVTLWTDGVATVAAAAKLGDASSVNIWNNLTENTKAAAQRLQKNYLDASGHSDKIVLINIANDKDTSKVLYQTYKGLIVYDYVSGIGENN